MSSKLSAFFEADGTRAQVYQDFMHRYSQDPTQISDSEVLRCYGELASFLDDQEMDKAHEAAFEHLSADERRGLAQQYQYASRDPMRPFEGYPQSTPFSQTVQPRRLGRMTRNAAQHDPALLEELVGATSPFNGASVKLAMAGVAATLAGRYLGKR